MPEIVEVEKLMRQLRPAWIGRSIRRFIFPKDSPRPTRYAEDGWLHFSDRVKDREVWGLSRWGKFLYVILKDGFWRIHLSSTGWFLPGNYRALRSTEVDPIWNNFIHYIGPENCRVVIELNDGQWWNYHDPRTWGRWKMLSVLDIEEKVGGRQGPDWLVCPDRAEDALIMHESRRKVKDVLTDRAVTAGVGNYLACEACFDARVHPHSTWSGITLTAQAAVVLGVKRVIEAGLAFPDHEHWMVFKREGKPCKMCGTKISYLKDGSSKRGSYFCSKCQGGLNND